MLAIGPTQAAGAKLSKAGVDTGAAPLRSTAPDRYGVRERGHYPELRLPQLRQEQLVGDVMGADVLALLGVLNAICESVEKLVEATAAACSQPPDYEIITTFPGLADSSGAVVLGKMGEDRSRFTDDRALKGVRSDGKTSPPLNRGGSVCQVRSGSSLRPVNQAPN